MPNYTDIRVDHYLTRYIRDWRLNEPGDFIVDKICPRKKSKGSSYKFKYYAKEILRSDISDLKAQKGKTNEVGFDIFTGEGTIKRRSLMSEPIPYDVLREAPDAVDIMTKFARFLTGQLQLQQEMRMVALLEATANTTAAGNTWGNASGDILTNLRTLKNGVFGNCGSHPTHIAATNKAWEDAAASAKIEGQIKYQDGLSVLNIDGEKLAKSNPAGLKGVISKAQKDTSVKGATESISHVLGHNAYAVLVDAGVEALTWAIQPFYEDFKVFRWRDDNIGCWFIKVSHAIDIKVVCDEALYELTDVTA